MKSDHAIIGPVQVKGADLVPLPSQVREYIRASKAENTLRGYQSDWRHFCRWSGGHQLCPLLASPETVASYIAECATRLRVGSIQRRLNAIAEAHKATGLESPTHHPMVKNTMKGIRRILGTAPVQKAPALTPDVCAMVGAADGGLIGVRDRALPAAGQRNRSWPRYRRAYRHRTSSVRPYSSYSDGGARTRLDLPRQQESAHRQPPA
jgi:hypothetical protein